MPSTKHIFTYTPHHLGGKKWDVAVQHTEDTRSSPITGLNIVEIEIIGCTLGDIRINVSISPGSFVIFSPKIGTSGLPSDVAAGDLMSRHIYITVDGINNAAFVYSNSGVYPYNLSDSIPTLHDLGDKKWLEKLSQIDAFAEYVGFDLSTANEEPRDNSYQVW